MIGLSNSATTPKIEVKPNINNVITTLRSWYRYHLEFTTDSADPVNLYSLMLVKGEHIFSDWIPAFSDFTTNEQLNDAIAAIKPAITTVNGYNKGSFSPAYENRANISEVVNIAALQGLNLTTDYVSAGYKALCLGPDTNYLATNESVDSKLSQLKSDILGDDLEETFDTLKAVQDWADEHGTEYAELVETVDSTKSDVTELTTWKNKFSDSVLSGIDVSPSSGHVDILQNHTRLTDSFLPETSYVRLHAVNEENAGVMTPNHLQSLNEATQDISNLEDWIDSVNDQVVDVVADTNELKLWRNAIDNKQVTEQLSLGSKAERVELSIGILDLNSGQIYRDDQYINAPTEEEAGIMTAEMYKTFLQMQETISQLQAEIAELKANKADKVISTDLGNINVLYGSES